MPPCPNPNCYSKNWCCYYSKPRSFPQTNNMSKPSEKGEKNNFETWIFNFKKWRTKNCMQWVLGSVLVLSPVLIGGQFPVLVRVADWFPFLISSSEFFFSKFKTHDPGTQWLETANTNYFFIFKEHPITCVMFHISIVLAVY